MIRVDRNKQEMPKTLNSPRVLDQLSALERFYSLPDEERFQSKVPGSLPGPTRSMVSSALLSLFDGKCAYCESRISATPSGTNVDHFRPTRNARGKDNEASEQHYWWLSIEWRNLYACCRECNNYKRNNFPVVGNRANIGTRYDEVIAIENQLLIDPCNEDPEEEFLYLASGEILNRTERGEVTIQILQLNRKDLIYDRRAELEHLYNKWQNIIRYWENNKKLVNEYLKEWEGIVTSKTGEPFLGMKRYFIKSFLDLDEEIKDYFYSRSFEMPAKEGKQEPHWGPTKLDTLKIIPLDDFVSGFQSDVLKKSTEEEEDKIDISTYKNVFLEKLVIENFKCFENFSIPLDKGEKSVDSSQSWVALLGENGVGKSSILQLIALCLTDEEYLRKLDIKPYSELLLNPDKEAKIELYLVGKKEPIRVDISTNSIRTSNKKPLAVVLGYGSTRLPENSKIKKEKGSGAVRIQNLFDSTCALVNVEEWVSKLNDKDFARVAGALKDLIETDRKFRVKRTEPDEKGNRRLVVNNGEQDLSFKNLSDGYRTIITLAADIMEKFMKQGELLEFNAAEGIVLIDELGTHLHPRWKMRVVKKLRMTFKYLQFIVSTHEPLCIVGMRDKEVTVIKRDNENKIVYNNDLPSPEGFSVEQILTSEFFGLQSTVDPDLEEEFDEYYRLLAKKKSSALNPEEENRMVELQLSVKKLNHMGKTLRDDLAYHAIDELLAEKKAGLLKINSDDLRPEAVKRVKLIWEELKKNDL
ncbi:MAG: AAA family ATPase [Crocinitomicaceae bacterium]